MNALLSEFLFDTLGRSFEMMNGPLANYEQFSSKLAELVKVKQGGNEQFSFDVALDELVHDGLEKHALGGKVFSEESGWYEIAGEKRYRVVYDPFCNSSLASRTFREGALGISIFSYDYEFLTAAILDFQIGLLGMVDDGVTRFYQIGSRREVQVRSSRVDTLREAWVVLTLETREERELLSEAATILKEAARVVISSGHVYWLRLAAGFVDAYSDPFGGEELYEMFACMVAVGAGCRVTDRGGAAFEPAMYLKEFEQDRHFRFYPVAARSARLHEELQRAFRQS